ncbi:Fe-S cluster assembly sulfur transfer protein SufU [Canibacter zhoujuaniae]|uniref:Fe-S cluster assembly sulfur transfer protein SufU n=1 Tax=Canibacter zhoujuaniae TaxID=2708343 RepID=UPI00141F3749|nr:SUF system NifU family Fe-S cluster assembly protein [Canibacter zhoujuaniae]
MSALDSLYQELILDHSKRPHGQGELESETGHTASHHELNPSCGDEITFDVAYDAQSGTITEVKWRGQGCSISQSSASILTELLEEKPLTIAEAQERIDAFREMLQSRGEGEPNEQLLGDAVAFQGVAKFVMRVKCAMLSWVALEADLRQLEAQLSE